MIELIQKFQKNPQDTGSSEVQIILMTHKIQAITGHIKSHSKDFHCRRGLMKCVSRRKALLKYLKRQSQERYQSIIKALGLRH